MSRSEVAPRQDKRDKKRKNPNDKRTDAPAPAAPELVADPSFPTSPTPRPQPPQASILGQTTSSATEAPVAVEAVMDLFGTIPDAVNDVAQLASTVQKFAPLKPAVIALALGAGAAFVAFLTLRGEQ